MVGLNLSLSLTEFPKILFERINVSVQQVSNLYLHLKLLMGWTATAHS